MQPYSEHYMQTPDGLKLFYRDFNKAHNGSPVLCLPGITRNSRDFEDIAPHMSRCRRVIALDFRGRGFSEWDKNWKNYRPATYVADVLALLDSLRIRRAIFLGTSLGGLVSMTIAAKHAARVAAVILNDVGPEVGAAGLARIKSYIGRARPVANWNEAIAQVKETYGLAWRDLPEACWLRLAHRGYREDSEGVPKLDMDPMVGKAAREVGATLDDPWELFEAIPDLPLMVIHGELSDILTDEIVARMQARKPGLRHVAVANRGHVPLLDEPECIEAIDTFIRNIKDDCSEK